MTNLLNELNNRQAFDIMENAARNVIKTYWNILLKNMLNRSRDKYYYVYLIQEEVNNPESYCWSYSLTKPPAGAECIIRYDLWGKTVDHYNTTLALTNTHLMVQNQD